MKPLFYFILSVILISQTIISEPLYASQTPKKADLLAQEITALENRFFRKDETVELTLSQATKTGFLNNFDIQIAASNWEKAKAEIDKAKSRYDTEFESAYTFEDDQSEQPSVILGTKIETRNFNTSLSKKLPTGTTLEAGYQMEWQRTDSSFATFIPTYDGVGTVRLKQDLLQNFFGIVDRTEVNIQELIADIENAEKLETTQEEILKIRSAFWDLGLAIENYASIHETLQISLSLLKVGERKSGLGTIEKADLFDLTSQTHRRIKELLIAENQVRLKSNALAFLLGMEGSPVFYPKNSLTPFSFPLQFETELQRALDKRPLLQKAKQDVERTGLLVTQKKSLKLPKFEGVASYSANGLDTNLRPSIQESFKTDNPAWFFGFEFSVPLENRQARGVLKQAEEERKSAKINFQKAAAKTYWDVSDAVLNLKTRWEEVVQTKEIVELEEKKYHEEEKQFQIGRSNSERLTRFQDDWIRSKILDSKARRDALVALDQLGRARGTLLEDVQL